MTKAQELVYFLEEFIGAKVTDMRSTHIEDSLTFIGVRKDLIKKVEEVLKEAHID